MTNEEIEYAIERIEHLERIFDEVQNSFKNDQNFFENKKMEVKVSLLTQYLESGQWLRDFELDEKGKLPSGLKRGILSEDGLYNLITDIEQSKSIEEIAHMCNMSLSSFERRFKAYSGMSPVEYRLSKKLDRAEIMLKTGSMTLERIAEELNFYDGAYLCRIFKKKKGYSPSSFRKTQ